MMSVRNHAADRARNELRPDWAGYLTLLLVAVFATKLSAGTSNEWRYWQAEQGLTDSYIESVSRTPEGIYWAVHADVAGLSRFDGREWVRVPSPFLRNPFDSLDGHSGWIFAANTLQHFANGKWDSFELPGAPARGKENSKGDRILRVLDLGNSQALVLFSDRLARFSARNHVLEPLPVVPPDSKLGGFAGMERASDGSFWIVGNNGVARVSWSASANPPYLWRESLTEKMGVDKLSFPIPGPGGELFPAVKLEWLRWGP